MNKDLTALIKQGDSSAFGFKQSFDTQAIETVCTFSNVKAGKLLGGVFDDGKTKGVTFFYETFEQLTTNSYTSQTLNKLMVEAFYLTGNVEKYGSGYQCIQYLVMTFDYEESSVGYMVTVVCTQKKQLGLYALRGKVE